MKLYFTDRQVLRTAAPKRYQLIKTLMDTVAEERIEGPTPNGGAYALAYFSAGGVLVDKAQADAVEVIEFAADGAQIMRTYADLPGVQQIVGVPSSPQPTALLADTLARQLIDGGHGVEVGTNLGISAEDRTPIIEILEDYLRS